MTKEINERKIINCLYEQFKNSPKKLKIVCDWDEVIQPCEPYACFLEMTRDDKIYMSTFEDYFTNRFWGDNKDHSYLGEPRTVIEYSAYGSKLKEGMDYGFGVYYDRINKKTLSERKKDLKEQIKIKNSPNFYQQAPFLSIAKELLKLIKEDKIEKLIFLSAYDKRKFPNGDYRKINIFMKTFFNLSTSAKYEFKLELIPFDSEIQSLERTSIVGDQNQGQSKVDWIKENANDFDIVIDDNPNICRSIIEMELENSEDWDRHGSECMGCSDCADAPPIKKVLTPYYPSIEEQHHHDVLLLKTSVSDLTKDDFK